MARLLASRHHLPALPLHRGHLLSLFAREAAIAGGDARRPLPQDSETGRTAHPLRTDLQRSLPVGLADAHGQRTGPYRPGVGARRDAVPQLPHPYPHRNRRRDPRRLLGAAGLSPRSRRSGGRRRLFDGGNDRGLHRPAAAAGPSLLQDLRSRRAALHGAGRRHGDARNAHRRVRPPVRTTPLR